MSEPLLVEFFVEDNAHHQLLVPLVERVAREENVDLRCRVRNARGGHAGAMGSFTSYQTLRSMGVGGTEVPALMVVGIDGNCSTFARKREQIREATQSRYAHLLVTACPDPHIERWYLADPESFHTVVGAQASGLQRKCVRQHYKQMLTATIARAGHPSTLEGVEFGRELAEAMDLFRAGKNDASLKAFIGDLREGLRRASQATRDD